MPSSSCISSHGFGEKQQVRREDKSGSPMDRELALRHDPDLLWYARIPSGSHLTEMLALICSAYGTWKTREASSAGKNTPQPWHPRRGSAARPRLAFARRKVSLRVPIREDYMSTQTVRKIWRYFYCYFYSSVPCVSRHNFGAIRKGSRGRFCYPQPVD
jgi:hypothetical protein